MRKGFGKSWWASIIMTMLKFVKKVKKVCLIILGLFLFPVSNLIKEGYEPRQVFESKQKKYKVPVRSECGEGLFNFENLELTIEYKNKLRRVGFYYPYFKEGDEYSKSMQRCFTKDELKGKKIFLMFHGWQNSVFHSFQSIMAREIVKSCGNNTIVLMVDTANIANSSWLVNRVGEFGLGLFPPYENAKWTEKIVDKVYEVFKSLDILENDFEIMGHSLGVLPSLDISSRLSSVSRLWVVNPPGNIFGRYNISHDNRKVDLSKNFASKIICFSSTGTIYDDLKYIPSIADKNYLINSKDYNTYEKHWVFQRVIARSVNKGVECNANNGELVNIDFDWFADNDRELKKFPKYSKNNEIKYTGVFHVKSPGTAVESLDF